MFKKALILAGGKGTRLRPLTYVIPKPLLPVGEKPIIEHTIDRLKKYDITDIYISVNYKADMLTNYLKDGKLLGVNITYIFEEKPTGTAGCLTLLPDIDEDIVLMNGDVLSDIDFCALFEELKKFDFVITAIVQENSVDFGVLEIDDSNKLIGWKEKPNYRYYINAGIYGISKKVLKFIKERFEKGIYLDMPNLWSELIKNGFSIGVYVHEGYWRDVGRIDDYIELSNIKPPLG